MRNTYADIDSVTYRLRAASRLLGVTDNTVRSYADSSGIPVRRASDISPNAPQARIFDPATIFRIAQWRRAQKYTKSPKTRPQIITVDVIKGGTGKTTTAVELAIHLQLMGLRTLLVDLDIQANATQMMGYEPDLTTDEAEMYQVSQDAIVTATFASLLIPFIESKLRHRPCVQDGIQAVKKPFMEDGPHLVPADTFLGDMEQVLANAKGQRELYIRQMIDDSIAGKVAGFRASDYDVIIFDCPPSVSFTSTAAIAAADYVIAPIRLDAFSVKGLVRLMGEIDAIDSAYHIRPELVILPTHYAPQLTRIGRMQGQLQQHYRNLLAPCSISSSEEFPKTIDSYLPLSIIKPTSNASAEYRVFASFMFEKIVNK